MKLSDWMMLGTVTCKMEAMDINSCAIGAALNAMGTPQASGWSTQWRYDVARNAFPWLNEKRFIGMGGEVAGGMEAIYERFDTLVCTGRKSFEWLVDYVRSIEPECGECNRFDCNCKSSAPEVCEVVAYV